MHAEGQNRQLFEPIDVKIRALETMSAECGAMLTRVAVEHRCIGKNGAPYFGASVMTMKRRSKGIPLPI